MKLTRVYLFGFILWSPNDDGAWLQIWIGKWRAWWIPTDRRQIRMTKSRLLERVEIIKGGGGYGTDLITNLTPARRVDRI